MSLAEHYAQDVKCNQHGGCYLEPFERCLATVNSGDRCRNRAAPSSLYCATAHSGPNWHPGLAPYRRGHPLEVVHVRGRRTRGRQSVEPLMDPPIELVLAWGPLGEEQTGEVASDGSLETALQEILG